MVEHANLFNKIMSKKAHTPTCTKRKKERERERKRKNTAAPT